MRKIIKKCLLFILVGAFVIVGCSQRQEDKQNIQSNQNETFRSIKNEDVLIVYFTCPESDGTDTSSSASRVIDNDIVIGANEYIAKIIQQQTGGELFQIETVQQYPKTHEQLVDQASNEQSQNARPKLKSKIENLDDYEIIFLGYPNWWGDMPMPLYTFLEEYDLSGKMIIPFGSHGGSGFSNTVDTIKSLQSNALVSDEGLMVSRDKVSKSKNEIIEWLKNFE